MSFQAIEPYAGQAFRFFFKDPRPDPDSKAAELNLAACETAYARLSVRHRQLLREVYTSGIFPLYRAVKAVSDNTGVDEPELWSLLKRATKYFAEARGL